MANESKGGGGGGKGAGSGEAPFRWVVACLLACIGRTHRWTGVMRLDAQIRRWPMLCRGK